MERNMDMQIWSHDTDKKQSKLIDREWETRIEEDKHDCDTKNHQENKN